MSGAEINPAAVNAAQAGAAPGERLAEARRAQNLLPTEIARQLKLSVWQVEALEAGHYQQLPGPVFVRGFIRNYAKLLKLDPDELLRAAGGSLLQSVPLPARAPSQDIPFPATSRPRRPVLAATAAILVGALIVYEFFWNEAEQTTSQAVSVTPVSLEPQSSSAATAASPQPADEARAVPQPTAETAALKEQGALPASAAGAPADPVRPPRPGERQVRLAFEQESWVEIRDRNERVIFSQLNRPGTQQFVSGAPPLSIVVGNAQGVRLTYEDRPIDLASHTKIDVARLTLP
jgi:cytoskeleton protein RodZ